MGRNTKLTYGLLIVLMLSGLSASFLNNRPIYASDTLVYLDGAASLAAGKGYLSDGQPQTAWPPGYSFLLSFFYRAGVDSIATFKALNIGIAAVALVLAYLIMARIKADAPLLTTILIGVYFPWIYYTHFVGSDLLFCLLFFLFLYGAGLFVQKNSRKGLWLAAVSVMVVPIVRMAGIALWVPWLVMWGVWRWQCCCEYSGSRRKLVLQEIVKAVGMVLIIGLPLGLWAWRNYTITGSWTSVQTGITPEYLASLREMGVVYATLLNKILINLRGYANILVIPDQSRVAQLMHLPLVIKLACGGVTFLMLVGWLNGLRRRDGMIPAICFAAYGGMLLVHNWYDIRYLLPILPLYFVYFVRGFLMACSWMVGRIPAFAVPDRSNVIVRRVTVIMLILMIAGNAAVTLASPASRNLRSAHYSGATQNLYAACEFLRQARAQNVLISSGGFARQWIGSKVVPVLSLLNKDGQLEDFNLPGGVDYILFQQKGFVDYDRKYLTPILEANVASLQAVYSNDTIKVYQVGDR